MPTPCTLSTTVSPGAAIAAGSGLSAALAPPASSGRSRKGVAFAIGRMGCPQLMLVVIASQRVRANARPDDWLREAIQKSFRGDGLDCFVASLLAMTIVVAALRRRHRLHEVIGNLVEEAGGREPALVGADEQREVLGHVAFLDRCDADLLQRGRKSRELIVVVELGAVAKAA